jgi:transforming growth factor-beta-induced protein
MNRRSFLKTSVAGAVAVGAAGATRGVFAQTKDIVDTAVGAGTFKTLAAALGAAGLVDTLKGAGPFTVFAPTDDAFAKLPAGTVENLLKPENKDQLVAILTYHVVAGSVKAADVVKLSSAKTVNGADVKITVSGSSVKVNDANVVTTDIMASNGVIHVIDAVILPPAAPTPTLPQTGAAYAPVDQASKDIVDTAVGAGTFKTLAAALGAAGLVDTLKGAGPFTVFAPTDDAFAKLPAGTVDTLLKPENKDQLVAILTYHVVAGSVLAADVVKLTSAKTVNGAEVKITVSGSSVKVNDANVVTTDILASNGVIHVIDAVILPPAAPTPTLPQTGAADAPVAQGSKDIVDTAVGAGSFKTLAAALTAAGLVDTLKGAGPFTVFAPTDDAFAKLPKGTVENLLKPENKKQLTDILTYHVVSGSVLAADVVKLSSAKTVNGADVKIMVKDGKVKVNDANVVTTDILASNGVIHVIDAVILPPAAPTVVEPAAAPAKPMDIVDTAVANGNFKTLAAALDAAGLIPTLKRRGPYTVYAPTDEAFAKLPAGTVENLLKPENRKQLVAILTYHVTAGKKLDAKTIAAHSGVGTVQGTNIKVTAKDGKVMLNNATVLTADVMATNGVIHVIDSVMLPPGNIIEVAAGAGSFKTLAAALEAAGLTNTLKTGKWTVFAPTDEAFAKLPKGTVENLLKPENKKELIRVLTYHVVRGQQLSGAVVSRHSSVRSLQGTRIRVVRDGDGIKLNGSSSLLSVDVPASNGVIHVIDEVLLP